MKEIPLTRGFVTIVDDDDYDYLMQWKWFASDECYAARTDYPRDKSGKRMQRKIIMHRLIMNCPVGLQVDHISGDKLDNRRENLRICTNQQNAANQNKTNKIITYSRFKGVSFRKDRHTKQWFGQIIHRGKKRHLGFFNTEIEAAEAYNFAASRLFGEFARLNDLTKS